MLCFCITKSVYAEDIIFQNSFEEIFDNWELTNSSVIFNLLDQPVYEGTQSAGILNNADSSYGIEHVVSNITEETDYSISSFIKVNDPPPSKVFIRIAWYESPDATGSQLKTADSDVISQVEDWQKITFFVTSPHNAHSAKIRLLVSSGAAFFDSVSVSKYIAPIPTPSILIQPTILKLASTQEPSEINHISISEVMVNPETGEQEWIELYNGNEEEVTLANWFFDDIKNGGSAYKTFSLTIPAKGFASFNLTSSIFNNSGDDVRILDSNLTIKDELRYNDSEQGFSIGRYQDKICIQQVSKNQPNNACELKTESNNTPTPTTISPSVQTISNSISRIKTPTNSISKIQRSNLISETPYEIQITDILEITEKDMQQKPSVNYSELLAFIAGSNSLLAGISLVSKIFIFRYT